jgi:hypothetical protein
MYSEDNMTRIRVYLNRSLLLASALVLLCCGTSVAADDQQALLAKEQAIGAKLKNNQFNAPIYLESTESHGSLRVDMYGIFNHPFEKVKDALDTPAEWCDIAPLHINIKACTYKMAENDGTVTLYSGRKYYQPPKDAYPLKLTFRDSVMNSDYFDINLTAEEGPLSTKDHHIRVQAVPLDKARTFLHFSYTYSTGAMARMAIKSYFTTIGREKVGFSTVRKGGKSYYVDGVRGAIERNTVRYYLALQSYLDTLRLPESQRFEQRLSRWYDMTARYKQLKENEKGEYLADKRKEHANQVALQSKLGN